MQRKPLLEVRDLTTIFDTPKGPLRAVDGVSFTVERGKSHGIVGESGSGKSVLVRTIMNLLPGSASVTPESTVSFGGRDIDTMSAEEKQHLWGPQISMIFQDPMTALNPVRKIGAQIADPQRFHLGRSKREAWENAADLLTRVGISDPRRRLDQYPHELSGGMRQRVMIAIAIGCEPDLLIADEPTTALDVTVQRQILDLLSVLQRDRDMGMILITHDLGVVARHTDDVSVMYAGQFVESAPTRVLFRRMRHRYTSALFRSTPRIDATPHSRLFTIAGRPPDLLHPPSGCRFAARCNHVLADCARTPKYELIEGTHRLACHNPNAGTLTIQDEGRP
ncbi:ABC transporter ATP-binding protein [Rhodococcus sp. T2V]|uniref:ABC transporter ATP-binding protein n=1 Tax=Rhodococcus sp. T2V TaxID=3034164 RepID=UPI0023E30E71|nr:ABC transporter ATP-binding protein [Rhodococcus sp. T2V]MDF3308183.1 ABC transporter ATP-binding protein [Rhodococcus sp. T2V]